MWIKDGDFRNAARVEEGFTELVLSRAGCAKHYHFLVSLLGIAVLSGLILKYVPETWSLPRKSEPWIGIRSGRVGDCFSGVGLLLGPDLLLWGRVHHVYAQAKRGELPE